MSTITSITTAVAFAVAISGAVGQIQAQQGTIDMSAERWCADSGTACWSDPDGNSSFNGVRIVADLDLSFLFQRGDNRFQGAINTLPKVAVETNLLGGWISLQIAALAPGTIQLDEQSPARRKLRSDLRQEGKVHFDYGWLVGLSFLDGSLGAGYGRIVYDRRDFEGLSATESSYTNDQFGYIALQPISSIRANLKGKRSEQPATEAEAEIIGAPLRASFSAPFGRLHPPRMSTWPSGSGGNDRFFRR